MSRVGERSALDIGKEAVMEFLERVGKSGKPYKMAVVFASEYFELQRKAREYDLMVVDKLKQQDATIDALSAKLKALEEAQ